MNNLVNVNERIDKWLNMTSPSKDPLYLYSLETLELPAVYPVTCPLGWLWWRPFLVLKLFSSCRNSCSSYVSRYFRIHLVKPRLYIKVGYSSVRKMSSPSIHRSNPYMTSLIIEARVTSYEVFMNLCLEDNSFRAFSSEVIPFI